MSKHGLSTPPVACTGIMPGEECLLLCGLDSSVSLHPVMEVEAAAAGKEDEAEGKDV